MVPQYANVQPDGHADIITGVPGTLTQPPYYWWLCGAMFNELINYWHYTGDDTYNDLVREGMIFQMGEHYDLVQTIPFLKRYLHRTAKKREANLFYRNLPTNLKMKYAVPRLRLVIQLPNCNIRVTTINSSGPLL